VSNDIPLTHRFRVDRVERSRVREVDLSKVAFSSIFSDHMFTAEFRCGRWGEGVIRPFGPISLSPSVSASAPRPPQASVTYGAFGIETERWNCHPSSSVRSDLPCGKSCSRSRRAEKPTRTAGLRVFDQLKESSNALSLVL